MPFVILLLFLRANAPVLDVDAASPPSAVGGGEGREGDVEVDVDINAQGNVQENDGGEWLARMEMEMEIGGDRTLCRRFLQVLWRETKILKCGEENIMCRSFFEDSMTKRLSGPF